MRLSLLPLGLFVLATAGTVLPRWSPKAGEKLTYTFTGSLHRSGQPIALQGTYALETTAVTNGFVSTKVTFSGKQATAGRTESLSSSQVLQAQPDGSPLSAPSAVRGKAGLGMRFYDLNAVVTNAAPISEGESWKRQIAHADPKVPACRLSYTFVGEAKLGGFDTYQITLRSLEVSGTAPTADEGTLWIDKATGKLLKRVDHYRDLELIEGSEPVSGTITMVLSGA